MNSKSLHEIHMMQSASGADPTSPSRNKTSLSLDSRLKSGGTPRGASNGDQHLRSRSNRLQQVQQSSFPRESSASSVYLPKTDSLVHTGLVDLRPHLQGLCAHTIFAAGASDGATRPKKDGQKRGNGRMDSLQVQSDPVKPGPETQVVLYDQLQSDSSRLS